MSRAMVSSHSPPRRRFTPKRRFLIEISRAGFLIYFRIMNKNTKEFYTKRLRLYNAMTGLVRHKRSLKNFLIKKNILKSGMKILDAGCGSGALTKALIEIADEADLSGMEFFGFDLTPAMLNDFDKWAKRHNKIIKLKEADVLDRPDDFPDSWSNFDIIFSSGMLEYIVPEKLPKVLDNLRRFLKPGGRLIVFVSRKNILNKFLIEKPWRARTYTKENIIKFFKKADFELLAVSKFKSWGFAVIARRP